jgi:hypothetical protein
MEFAIHVQSAADLDRLDDWPHWEASEKLRPDIAALGAALALRKFERAYWGTELCENLIADASALERVVAGGIPLTLLTPYVSDRGLARLRPLFAALPVGSEVVFNDWGVLRVLRREYPSLRPVQGRLLFKALRDPRITTEYVQLGETPQLDALRGSALDSAPYAGLLERYNVKHAEMDLLPQGNNFSTGIAALSVYAPFGVISTARVCMAAALGYRKADKFEPGAPCRHECQTHLVEYQYTNSPFDNRDQRFWLKGQTYFYVHTPEMASSLAAAIAAATIQRLVWQPRVPMMS